MIGKSYIFHLFLFLLILPDSIYSQDNICLIPQVESMVRKKGTLSIERLESIHFPDEWKNTGNLLVSDLKELANLSVMVNASNPSCPCLCNSMTMPGSNAFRAISCLLPFLLFL